MSDTPRTDTMADRFPAVSDVVDWLLGMAKEQPHFTRGQSVNAIRDMFVALSAAESKVDALMREQEEQIERCAKVCDDYAALQNEAWVQPGHAIRSCAWAIRALVREQNTTQEDSRVARSTNHPSIEGG